MGKVNCLSLRCEFSVDHNLEIVGVKGRGLQFRFAHPCFVGRCDSEVCHPELRCFISRSYSNARVSSLVMTFFNISGHVPRVHSFDLAVVSQNFGEQFGEQFGTNFAQVQMVDSELGIPRVSAIITILILRSVLMDYMSYILLVDNRLEWGSSSTFPLSF